MDFVQIATIGLALVAILSCIVILKIEKASRPHKSVEQKLEPYSIREHI